MKSTCNDFLWLLTDLFNLLNCGELSEADYIIVTRLKAIQVRRLDPLTWEKGRSS